MSRDLEARSAIVARARPAFAITATLFTVIGLTLFSRDLSEESIRWAMRLSVDTAFPFFFLAFTAASVHKLKPSAISQYLLRNRRYLGISFAALFLLHGTLIYVLSQLYPEPFFSQLTDGLLYGGLLTFGVVALMAATSNDFSVRRLLSKQRAPKSLVAPAQTTRLFCRHPISTHLPRQAGSAFLLALCDSSAWGVWIEGGCLVERADE